MVKPKSKSSDDVPFSEPSAESAAKSERKLKKKSKSMPKKVDNKFHTTAQSKSAVSTPPTPVSPIAKSTDQSDIDNLPLRNRKRKLHTYEKVKLAYENAQKEKKNRQEARLQAADSREQAAQQYKKNKKDKLKMTKYKRTKKGQPKLDLQIQHLLMKIEGKK